MEIIDSYFPYGLKMMFKITLSAPQPDSASYPSKRVRMDGVFLRLAGLLQKISPWLCLQNIPQSSPASRQKTPSIPPLLLGFTQSLFALRAVSIMFEISPIHLLLLPIGILSTKSRNVSPKQSTGVIKLHSCRALMP